MRPITLAVLMSASAFGSSAAQPHPTPEIPEGEFSPAAEVAFAELTELVSEGQFDYQLLRTAVDRGDVRGAWYIVDLLRFVQEGQPRVALEEAFARQTGIPTPEDTSVFLWGTNRMLSWGIPAWDGYKDLKRQLFVWIDYRWAPFFDQDHGVDWRILTWGGVQPDDRPFGDNSPCHCIPSLDNPGTTSAKGGNWYDDDKIVFGLVVNGEAIAFPKNQMEVHEMVNMTLGGRAIGVPYCTLCGTAQAFFTDEVPGIERLVLRTSGLLSRSNKAMYDQATGSLFDTFQGVALTGSLGEQGVELRQASVAVTTWGDWKRAHPDTRILAEDGGIGRSYWEDPLRGRDDNGPIFPIGDVDPRLPVQELVLGVTNAEGKPVAFAVSAATRALEAGEPVQFEGLTVRLVDGLRVFDAAGNEVTSHQSFWFAWSQFNPATLLWEPGPN
ncbi:MAG: DUF3179 domain-containing (seleno)protein [Longimicrobiales bacterium]